MSVSLLTMRSDTIDILPRSAWDMLHISGYNYFSLRRTPAQAELVNAIVACTETGGEALVQHSSQKEFLRDLLVVQGVIKSPRSELEDLLAR